MQQKVTAQIGSNQISIETGKIAWEVPDIGPSDGKRDAGVLGTAGGILFYGDASGDFLAVAGSACEVPAASR